MNDEPHAAGDPAPPPSDCGGTTCRLCGEPLPPPDDAATLDAAAGQPPPTAGVPFALVECPGCGAQQVRTLGAPLCDGETLALQNALAYLARRRAEVSEDTP